MKCNKEQYKPRMSKKNVIAHILVVLVMAIILVVIATLTTSFSDIKNAFLKINFKDAVLLIFMALAFFVISALSGLVLRIGTNMQMNKRLSFYIESSDEFYNGITPLESGGPIVKTHYYRKNGVRRGKASAIVTVNFLIYKMLVILISTVAIPVAHTELLFNIGNWIYLIYLGYVLNITIFIVAILSITSKNMAKAGAGFLRFIGKIKPFRRRMNYYARRLVMYQEEWQEEIKIVLKRKFVVFFSALLRSIALVILYTIPFVIMIRMEVPVDKTDFGMMFAIAVVATSLTSWIPVPGAAIISKYAFIPLLIASSIAFNNHSEVVAVALTWRFLTYYLAMIYGAFFTLFVVAHTKRRERYQLSYERRIKNKDHLKIAIFTDAYDPMISGVVVSVDTLKEALEDLGHEVWIITTKSRKAKHPDQERLIRIGGIGLVKKSLSGLRFVPLVKRKAKKLAKYEFDVIHIHTELTMGTLGLELKKWTGAPLIYTHHTNYEQAAANVAKGLARGLLPITNKIIKTRIGRFINGSDVVILPTFKVYHKLADQGFNANFFIIPTGLDLHTLYKENVDLNKAKEIENKYNLKDEFVFLYVGRIAPEKSIEELFYGFKEYLKEETGKLLIVGAGPDLDQLKKLAIKLKIDEHVYFTGFVDWDEIGAYYCVGDVFMTASTSETQGLTYLEAMAASKVLVVRNDEVLDNFVKHGINGFLYNDVEEMKDLMLYVKRNPEKMLSIENEARKKTNDYTQEVYGDKVARLYRSLIK